MPITSSSIEVQIPNKLEYNIKLHCTILFCPRFSGFIPRQLNFHEHTHILQFTLPIH